MSGRVVTSGLKVNNRDAQCRCCVKEGWIFSYNNYTLITPGLTTTSFNNHLYTFKHAHEDNLKKFKHLWKNWNIKRQLNSVCHSLRKCSPLKHTHVLCQNLNNLFPNLLDRRGGQFAGFSRTKSKITLSTIPISYPSNLPLIPFRFLFVLNLKL